jgi:hypothetical protein
MTGMRDRAIEPSAAPITRLPDHEMSPQSRDGF